LGRRRFWSIGVIVEEVVAEEDREIEESGGW
jgi:hypothetical protein